MLTQKEATYYSEQLHPSFAGYLHDGEVTDRDCLSVIFYLLKRGVLAPIWQENNMQKKLVGVRKTAKEPEYDFEKAIIAKIFESGKEVSTLEVGKYIQLGKVETLIKENVNAIRSFPLIHQELQFSIGKHSSVRFSMNGKEVDTTEEATEFNKIFNKIILPVFLIVGLLLLVLFTFIKEATLLWVGGMFIAVPLFIFLTFKFSKKTASYELQEKVIPLVKKKYIQLYEFLKDHPLPSHRFTNEFLPFSIAFGLDTSWHKDFGLDGEIKLTNHPLSNKPSI